MQTHKTLNNVGATPHETRCPQEELRKTLHSGLSLEGKTARTFIDAKECNPDLQTGFNTETTAGNESSKEPENIDDQRTGLSPWSSYDTPFPEATIKSVTDANLRAFLSLVL